MCSKEQGQYYAVYIDPHNGHNHDYLLRFGKFGETFNHLRTLHWVTDEVLKDFTGAYSWFYNKTKSEVA